MTPTAASTTDPPDGRDGPDASMSRRYPLGAEIRPGGAAHVRVWAPKCRRMDLLLGADGVRIVPLEREADGHFSALVPDMPAGTLYRFRLDGEGTPLPDPASRFQPEGPHGPSCVVDPAAFAWTDDGWRGRTLAEAVIYEMHIGTFTPGGTWEAAMRELPALADLGVTVLEVMPVAEFPGRFGWGYDGVSLFAPTRLYGEPDDFRRFVDRAHALGMAVILDVVYNHFGPDGNHAACFSDTWFSDRYENEWGDPINFDGPGSRPVRAFFVANAACWIDEYHLDGLRLDATQQIFDASPTHILAEIAAVVRRAAAGRATLLVGENERQDVALLAPPERGGCGLDALWNDDLHHSAMVALTGRNEAYYSDHRGQPQEFVSAAKRGFLFQGQRYAWQGQRRGTPTAGVPGAALVSFLQNHDQIANSGRGLRVHALTSPGRFRAMTALTLLGPGTPMLFQGQEFAASSPFLYFADHKPELAGPVAMGRAEFLSQFPTLATPAMRRRLAPPQDEESFRRSVLDHGERTRNIAVWTMHRDLLALRRDDPVFRPAAGTIDGAVLAEEAFALRWFGADGDDRLLLVNLGRGLNRPSIAEPLLAPPAGRVWSLLWSSEDPAYGGSGTAAVDPPDGWHIPGHAAVVLSSATAPDAGAPDPKPSDGDR